jgi:hypothetical protein
VRVFYHSRPGAPGIVYEPIGEVEFCCDSLRRCWGVLVGFGARDCPRSTSREVNLYTLRQQANGQPVPVAVPVDYCPFCGEAVKVCRVK